MRSASSRRMATARGDRIAPLENPADVIQGLAAKIDELPQAEYPYYGGTHDGLMAALRSRPRSARSDLTCQRDHDEQSLTLARGRSLGRQRSSSTHCPSGSASPCPCHDGPMAGAAGSCIDVANTAIAAAALGLAPRRSPGSPSPGSLKAPVSRPSRRWSVLVRKFRRWRHREIGSRALPAELVGGNPAS